MMLGTFPQRRRAVRGNILTVSSLLVVASDPSAGGQRRAPRSVIRCRTARAVGSTSVTRRRSISSSIAGSLSAGAHACSSRRMSAAVSRPVRLTRSTSPAPELRILAMKFDTAKKTPMPAGQYSPKLCRVRGRHAREPRSVASLTKCGRADLIGSDRCHTSSPAPTDIRNSHSSAGRVRSRPDGRPRVAMLTWTLGRFHGGSAEGRRD